MKKLTYILLTVLFVTCSSEDANDCFQTSGSIIQKEVMVPDFNKIRVNRDVELILKEGIEHKVVVETGKNLLNDISIVVTGEVLELSDTNTCNFVRDYGITKVYVTAPDITEIRNASQFTVSSIGTLHYDSLQLISESHVDASAFSVGDFKLEINSQSLSITSNNLSSFYISGEVTELYVGFFAGAGRFEARDLIAQHIDIMHRGSNDMIVNPQQSITGELRSTGNVIAVHQPPIVSVAQFYTGALIFD